jgi:fructosamine-3-kinase
MTAVTDWAAMLEGLQSATGRELLRTAPRPVHGGCISESFRLESSQGPLFVKLAAASGAAMLEAEAQGLRELAAAQAVRVPSVLANGVAGEAAYLALEWIDLRPANAGAEAELGERLAWQHRTSAPHFGWSRDNTIGSTPQINDAEADWVCFFRERRLRYQLDLARRNGYDGALQQRGARLLDLMGAFFSSYRPVPSLLHGDLWGGNWSMDGDGRAVIFDPAVYYGDREADIAMTRLFGGFGPSFHTAYHAAWPLDQAAGTRRTLYNLYHLLNHLNLFGGGYGQQALGSIDRLLAELGH